MHRPRAAVVSALVLLVAALVGAQAPPLPPLLPDEPGVVRFGVVGDTGTGGRPAYEVAARLSDYWRQRPFRFVLMLGDNMYGAQGKPADFERKFERPFKTLLDGGVAFRAALGNHDKQGQRSYTPFNMNGERYYTFAVGDIQFFVIDSNRMDAPQRAWLARELAASGKRWKIAYFHHPLYSSGAKHGPKVDLRLQIEPLLVTHGVAAVFAGHEHFYERVKPQKGITYFTVGGSAKLRKGNIRKTDLTARGFDTDRSFMVVQIAGNRLEFQAISRTGSLVDAGTIDRPGAIPPP
jgi:3',5'-cyclic AMP phosphodiesterase CpdA